MQIIKLTIPGTLPNMNEIIATSKKHYIMYSKMKKKYTALVQKEAEGLPAIQSADFLIQWYAKNRKIDPDNITAGQKFIMDGLVEAGVLPGDGWQQIGQINHKFHVDKDNPRIEVTIFEV